MMETIGYTYEVRHPELGTETVEADTKYDAIIAAAHVWDVRWTTIAKDCDVKQLGRVVDHYCRRCGAHISRPGLCPDCRKADKAYKYEKDRLARADRARRKKQEG